MTNHAWYDDLAMPPLLTAARMPYATSIRAGLANAGFDDVPRNGVRMLGGLARGDTNLRDVMFGTGVSKQAISQLVDTMVLRGYVTREPDAEDRRRLTVTLTDRGRAAAKVVRTAIAEVDDALADQVSARDLAVTRRTLGRLFELTEGA